jgi:hypothetical protein
MNVSERDAKMLPHYRSALSHLRRMLDEFEERTVDLIDSAQTPQGGEPT